MKKILATILCAVTLVGAFTLVCFATNGAEANRTVFTVLYEKALEHSGEILSALAFLGSLIIALTYKKGLLPLMKGALGALGSAVSSLGKEAEDSLKRGSDAIEEIGARLGSAEELIVGLCESFDSLCKRLSASEEYAAEGERAHLIIEAQVDMLYEIFMTSSLPQYTKDQVGERIADMRRSLAGAREGE